MIIASQRIARSYIATWVRITTQVSFQFPCTSPQGGTYISALSERMHDASERQNGPTMMARIGVMRALNGHVERVFNPDRKEHHWERRKLARDR
jgi:hypothetical protein